MIDFLSTEEDVVDVDAQAGEAEDSEHREEFDAIPDEGLKPAVPAKVFDATADRQEKIDNSLVENDKVFDGEIEDNKVPAVNNDFVITADRAEQLTEVVKLKTDIQDSGVVSAEEMANIEAILPGTITDEKPLNLYTSFASLTNFNIAIEEIDNSLNRNYDDLRTSLRDLIESWLNAKVPKLKETFTKVYSGMASLNKAHAVLLMSYDCDNIAGVPIYLNNGKRLQKFLDRDIRNYDRVESSLIGNFEAEMQSCFEQEKYFSLFKSLFVSHGKCVAMFNNAIYSIKNHPGDDSQPYLEELTDPSSSPNEVYGYAPITFSDVLELAGNKVGLRLLKALEQAVLMSVDYVKAEVAKIEEIQSSDHLLEMKIKELADSSAFINDLISFDNRAEEVAKLFICIYESFAKLFTELAQNNQ